MLHRAQGLFRILVILFVGLAAGCGSGGDSSNAARVQAAVDASWNAYIKLHGVPVGGLAVYIDSPAGTYFASSGMAAGVDQNTRFRIASNTKTFTAAAIMLLDQQGKLRIDDTINSIIPGQAIPYVPNTAAYDIPYKASITIRQLLAHTAGVWDVDNELMPATCSAPYKGMSYPSYVLATDPTHQFSPDEFAGVDATCQTSYAAPGAEYHYSDTGYAILARIIERVAGLTYDQFLMQNLITPNGLSSTSVTMLGTDQTLPAPFNPGYIYFQGVTTDATQDNMSMHIGEGNITSTPVGIARWVRRLVRGEAGPNAAAVQAMTTPSPQSAATGRNYGLGMSYVSGLGYGHTGANQGYLSLMVHDPAADVTTILYFNVWDMANLMTDQMTLLFQAARDARAVLGY